MKVEQAAMQLGCNFRVRKFTKEINGLMIKENKMWQQRAKSFWLVGEDKNYKYFYSRATQRNWQNRIDGITNSLGQWVKNSEEIAESFIAFYQELFVSSNPVIGVEDLDLMPNIVNDEMNSQLSQEFME